VRPHREPLTTVRRSRLFLPTIITFILTLTLMLGSMWLTVGRVQQIGKRHYAVGAEAGRLTIGINTGNTNAPTRWIAASWSFLFEPWFAIGRSPRATYASVPLWAPLLVLGYLAWRTRPRRIPPGHCHHCGYDLSGINPCPECGHPS
jgi:glycerol uptake facilitator-like aquaporin